MHCRLVFLKMSKAILCSGEERDCCIEITLLSEARGGVAGFQGPLGLTGRSCLLDS